jgi:hypothetical protein
MDLSDENPVRDILETPDNLDIEGAEEVKLTDASEFMNSLRHKPDEPRAEVYEYRITKLPAHEVLPMKMVKDVVISLMQDVDACKTNPQTQHMKLDEFRAWLMEENAMYKELFKKMPRLFRKIVSARITPEDKTHIMKMIEMRRVQEASAMSKRDREVQVGAYFREHFSRVALPGEEEEAVRNGTGYSGTPMTRDQVHADLGSK